MRMPMVWMTRDRTITKTAMLRYVSAFSMTLILYGDPSERVLHARKLPEPRNEYKRSCRPHLLPEPRTRLSRMHSTWRSFFRSSLPVPTDPSLYQTTPRNLLSFRRYELNVPQVIQYRPPPLPGNPGARDFDTVEILVILLLWVYICRRTAPVVVVEPCSITNRFLLVSRRTCQTTRIKQHASMSTLLRWAGTDSHTYAHSKAWELNRDINRCAWNKVEKRRQWAKLMGRVLVREGTARWGGTSTWVKAAEGRSSACLRSIGEATLDTTSVPHGVRSVLHAG